MPRNRMAMARSRAPALSASASAPPHGRHRPAPRPPARANREPSPPERPASRPCRDPPPPRPGFRLLVKREPFIPAAREVEEGVSAAHTVWSRSFGPARKSGKAGATVGQAASSTGKRSYFCSRFPRSRIGAILQPAAGFRDDFGPRHRRKTATMGSKGKIPFLLVRLDERTVGQGLQGVLGVRLGEASTRR